MKIKLRVCAPSRIFCVTMIGPIVCEAHVLEVELAHHQPLLRLAQLDAGSENVIATIKCILLRI